MPVGRDNYYFYHKNVRLVFQVKKTEVSLLSYRAHFSLLFPFNSIFLKLWLILQAMFCFYFRTLLFLSYCKHLARKFTMMWKLRCTELELNLITWTAVVNAPQVMSLSLRWQCCIFNESYMYVSCTEIVQFLLKLMSYTKRF